MLTRSIFKLSTNFSYTRCIVRSQTSKMELSHSFGVTIFDFQHVNAGWKHPY